jgi:uncharacterized membrane protein YwzB
MIYIYNLKVLTQRNIHGKLRIKVQIPPCCTVEWFLKSQFATIYVVQKLHPKKRPTRLLEICVLLNEGQNLATFFLSSLKYCQELEYFFWKEAILDAFFPNSSSICEKFWIILVLFSKLMVTLYERNDFAWSINTSYVCTHNDTFYLCCCQQLTTN